VRPESALVIRDESSKTVHPTKVNIGEIMRVKPGERVPLDGKLLNRRNAFDTSALTGESKPRHFKEGDSVLAGMINLNQVIELKVIKSYENSSISRILQMVQEATLRKAKTELFIRSFARVYTPIVVLLASLLVLSPYFFANPYVFDDWLYRGLVFLVISCPCALVISIPLGYFGGIGAASRNGILVKGSNFLDVLKDVETVVFDKTGTLTRGDMDAVAQSVGKALHIDQIFAELLPEEKAKKLEELKKSGFGVIAYAGDGINDAPVLALSDVGIAMGARSFYPQNYPVIKALNTLSF